MRVSQEERSRIDEHPAVLSRLDWKSPEHGRRERLGDSLALRGVCGECAVLVVDGRQQHAWTGAFEAHDPGVAELSTIEADGIRPETARQRNLIQALGVEPRDLQQQTAAQLIPVHGHEAWNWSQARDARIDRRDDRGRRRLRADRQPAGAERDRGRDEYTKHGMADAELQLHESADYSGWLE